MFLQRLKLSGFRNYTDREFEFKKKTTVFVGRNAVGKTNILEAIYMLASGESFRAQKIEEMVNWQSEVAHVEGQISNAKLQIVLTRGEVQGRRVQKRSYKVNGVPRRKLDFSGNLKAVIFRPEELNLIVGSPSLRRKFLDGVLAQVDREYRRGLQSYEKGLKRRNKLLDLINEGQVDRRALLFWDQLLIREGNILTDKRRELIDFVNATTIFPKQLTLVYTPSLISTVRLQQYAVEEVAAGYTLVGPHKDDFKILDNTRDMSVYGSRGEQRMAVLWLKMAELQFIEEKAGERPLLLLDDIFSELDQEHDEMVLSMVNKQQTLITTTDMNERFKKLELEIITL